MIKGTRKNLCGYQPASIGLHLTGTSCDNPSYTPRNSSKGSPGADRVVELDIVDHSVPHITMRSINTCFRGVGIACYQFVSFEACEHWQHGYSCT